MSFLFFQWKYWSNTSEEFVSINPSPCSSMVESLSPKESDDNNERDDLDSGHSVHPYPTDVNDCDFQDYSSYYQNMFYLDSNG